MANTFVKEITLSLIGDKTGEKWFGKFKVRTMLNHAQELERDRIRRNLLGEHAESAEPRAKSQAKALSELAVRITESPDWWKALDAGLEANDDNLIGDLYGLALKAEAETFAELKKQREEAEAALKASLENKAPTE